jgi:hypothetical protein
MEQVCISDLGLLLLGHRVEVPDDDSWHLREKLTGRGYLFVCDDESVRDSAIDYLHEIVLFQYLDFNAQPQGKKMSEMCIHAFDRSYYEQKEYGLDISVLSNRATDGKGLLVDNFQDIGLQSIRDAKLSLACLRSLGRRPYEITVIGVGSKESLDLIKLDPQLKATWAHYELVRNSIEQTPAHSPS